MTLKDFIDICRENWTIFEPVNQRFRENKGLFGTKQNFVGHS